jgi:hypothetical protein
MDVASTEPGSAPHVLQIASNSSVQHARCQPIQPGPWDADQAFQTAIYYEDPDKNILEERIALFRLEVSVELRADLIESAREVRKGPDLPECAI